MTDSNNKKIIDLKDKILIGVVAILIIGLLIFVSYYNYTETETDWQEAEWECWMYNDRNNRTVEIKQVIDECEYIGCEYTYNKETETHSFFVKTPTEEGDFIEETIYLGPKDCIKKVNVINRRLK